MTFHRGDRIRPVAFACTLVLLSTSGAASPPAEDLADLVEATLPGVVLLLNYREDGKLGYGSGLIIDDGGLVLTNLHVVVNARELGAMVYDPKRMSYAPIDGGLKRYLFEYHKDIVGARLIRGDPNIDLALVQIGADTSGLSKLPFGTGCVRAGQRVFVLGHPQEAVWSFTSGVISAIHHGRLQHDAATNVGNSGGPLIDPSGQVIGINTAKLFGNAEGIAFARPIRLAKRLIRQVGAPDELIEFDLSDPGTAVRNCIRAMELASPDYLGCIDWEHNLTISNRALGELYREFGIDPIPMERETNKKQQMKQQKEFLMELIGSGTSVEPLLRRRVRKWIARSDSESSKLVTKFLDEIKGGIEENRRRQSRAVERRCGLKVDMSNPRARIEVFKMGVRVEKVHRLDPDRAWVQVSGRNLDGSPYHHSDYMVRRYGVWLEALPPDPATLKTLPKGWNPPIITYEDFKQKLRTSLKVILRFMCRHTDHTGCR